MKEAHLNFCQQRNQLSDSNQSLTKLLKTSHVLSYEHILGFDSRGLICRWLLIIFSFHLRKTEKKKRETQGYQLLSQDTPLLTAGCPAMQNEKWASSYVAILRLPSYQRDDSSFILEKIQFGLPRRGKQHVAPNNIHSVANTEWCFLPKNCTRCYSHWEMPRIMVIKIAVTADNSWDEFYFLLFSIFSTIVIHSHVWLKGGDTFQEMHN